MDKHSHNTWVFRRNPMIRQGVSIETKKSEAFIVIVIESVSITTKANKKTRSKKLKLISNTYGQFQEKSY